MFLQSKENVLQLHQGSKELLQTLQVKEVIELPSGAEIAELHVIKSDESHDSQLMSTPEHGIREAIQLQPEAYHLAS